MNESSWCSESLPNNCYCQCFLDYSHYNSHKSIILLFSFIDSLMIYDVENLFMCSFAICLSSLVKYPFRYITHFLIGLYVYFWISLVICIYWITVFYHICALKIFSPFCDLFLHSLIVFYTIRKVDFIFNKIQFTIFFIAHAFGVASKISLLKQKSPRFSVFSSRNFIDFHVTFASMIYFKWLSWRM